MPVLSIRVKGAKLVAKRLEHLRKKIPEISRERLYETAKQIAAIMKTPGEDVTYPIRWDSEKQRKAFFASDGFTKPRGWKRPKGYVSPNIPYRRKGVYEKNWKVYKVPSGKKPATEGYEVANLLPWSKYVGGNAQGKRQSRIHKDRWLVFREQADKILKQLPKTVASHLKVIARREGFKVK